MSNPHDVAAVLGGLLSDKGFRDAMRAQREVALVEYGFVDVTLEDRKKIDKVMKSLEDGKLGKAQNEVDSECPNWPCPIIHRRQQAA